MRIKRFVNVNVKVNKVDGRQELAEEAFLFRFSEADAFLIAGVGEGFVGGDEIAFHEIGEGGVEGDHAVLAADFHHADEVFHLAAADTGADGGVDFFEV